MYYLECLKNKSFVLLTLILCVTLVLTACNSSKKHLDRGEQLLKDRKYSEAVMEFRAAADIDKNSMAAHWGLARAHEAQGDIFETISELQKVVEFDANNLDAKSKLGNYYLLLNPPQIADSEKLLGEIFAIDPNFVEAHILKASILSLQGKPDKDVIDVLQGAIAINPTRIESYLSLARFYMKINKPGEAETTIKKAIEVAPQSSLGYLEYARFFGFSGKTKEAEEQYLKAVEVEGSNIEAREALAQFYVSQKDLDKAEQVYKDIAATLGNSPEGRMELAGFYTSVGREDDSIAVYNDILKDSPNYSAARYPLATIYLERHQTENINEQLEKLLSANNNDAEALMLRARSKMQNNQAESAVTDLQDVLKTQPSSKSALFYMAQVRLQLGDIDQARAYIGDLEKYHPNYFFSRMLKIQASFSANQPNQALIESNELIQILKTANPNPDTDLQQLQELSVRAVAARGQAYLALGQINEARADLQEVLKLSPNSSSAYSNLAKLELITKNYAQASTDYEKALSIDKNNFDAFTGLMAIYKVQKQFQTAHDKIDAVLNEAGDKKDVLASMHYLKADLFSAQKDLDSATSELLKAIEADDEYLPAYSAYATILISQNQTDQAIEQYKKVVAKKPSSAVYSLIGMLEDARQNAEEAEKNYREALKISPDNSIAANNLAWLMAAYDRGNLDEGLQLAQNCVSKNPNVSGYYDTLGFVYYKKGLHSPAVEQFKKAISIDAADIARAGGSPNAGYHLRLALAYSSLGDKQSAQREAAIALKNEKGLSSQESEEAKKLLGGA